MGKNGSPYHDQRVHFFEVGSVGLLVFPLFGRSRGSLRSALLRGFRFPRPAIRGGGGLRAALPPLGNKGPVCEIPRKYFPVFLLLTFYRDTVIVLYCEVFKE